MQEQITPISNIHTTDICSVCHQKTLPEYYFCPNCGNKLAEIPLSTTVTTQFGLYFFSLILPSICFLFITKWKGTKYLTSSDPIAKQIGVTAWFLLIASTVFTFWSVYYVTQKIMNTISASISTDLSGYGY